ncbi:MAG: response regulator transcription factor, partial [Chloroflexota bacterium]
MMEPVSKQNEAVTPVRLMLVDDHEVVRLGLKSLIERFPKINVVAEAGSEQEAVAEALRVKPDVILMDIRLDGGSGIEATRKIKSQLEQTKVIMLTSYADQELLFDAIRAGAAGYMLKQVGTGELVRTIEAASKGESILDPALTPTLFDAVRDSLEKQESAAFSELTKQEVQVLALMQEGKTNKQIGEEMFLSHGTVRNYVSNILGKLQVANR